MSQENDETLEELAKRKLKREEQQEIEKLKQENLEMKQVIEPLAQEEFERQKQQLLDTITDQEKKEYVDNFITSPERLESIKTNMVLLQKTFEVGSEERSRTRSPTGRATLPPEKGTKDEAFEYIKKLYDVLEDPTTSEKERQFADAQISGLFRSYVQGRKFASESGKAGSYYLSYISCPECGGIISVPRGYGKSVFSAQCTHCGRKIGLLTR